MLLWILETVVGFVQFNFYLSIAKGNKSWIIVAQGDRGNYDELVGYLHPKKNLNPDEVAILVVGS